MNQYVEEINSIKELLDLVDTPIVIDFIDDQFSDGFTSFAHYDAIKYQNTGVHHVKAGLLNPASNIISSLAHELRHVWQWANGIAVIYPNGPYTSLDWYGSEYAPEPVKGRSLRFTNYYQHPWKIDARAFQAKFMRLYESAQRSLGVMQGKSRTEPVNFWPSSAERWAVSVGGRSPLEGYWTRAVEEQFERDLAARFDRYRREGFLTGRLTGLRRLRKENE